MTKKKKEKKEPQAVNFDIAKLRALKDIQTILVDCPEWAGAGFDKIWVRSMTGKSRDSYEAAIYYAGLEADEKGHGSNLDNLRANTVVATACDEEGVLIFTAEDAEWLGNMNAAALDRIVDAGQKLAGISEKDIKEMEKSLKGGQS